MKKILKKGMLTLFLICAIFFGFSITSYASQNNSEDEVTDSEDVNNSEEEENQIIDFKKSGYKIVLKNQSAFIYNGKAHKPEISVIYKEKAEDGTSVEKELPRTNADGTVNYSISYSKNKAIGTATITVTGNGSYTGTISKNFKIIPGATTVTISSSEKNIDLSWTKVKGAGGYRIYRSISKDSGYKLIKTITSGSTLKYTDNNRSYYKTHYYKIRAYKTVDDKNILGEYSTVVKHQIKSMTAAIDRYSSRTLEISWQKLSGASGYEIYRSTAKKGTYKKITTIKNGATISYKDENRVVGRKYYYKVRAYRLEDGKAYYSAYTNIVSKNTIPSKVKLNSETTYKSTKITLKWKKVGYATGYQIYRATSKDGTYKKVKTITNGSTLKWTNSNLKKNKDYYYKIRAYREIDGKTVYGDFSDIYTKLKGGWRYVKGYKLYYNEKGKLVKDVSSIIGKQASYVIKVNKQQNCVTVYAKDGDNGYIIPVKAFICSTGYATPTGTFYTPAKYRWRTLMGPCYGQWDTRIVDDILFHSVFYNKYNDHMTLSVTAYNKLGRTASHGCVRLTAGDAKWIYDNCKLKTKVIIYNGKDAGPLGKPTAYKLPYWHTWDPTDPTAQYKCKEKGCH